MLDNLIPEISNKSRQEIDEFLKNAFVEGFDVEGAVIYLGIDEFFTLAPKSKIVYQTSFGTVDVILTPKLTPGKWFITHLLHDGENK